MKQKFTICGDNKLSISRIGLGCMGMSEFYGVANDEESIKTIRRAYELGVNHFDTSDMYGINGHNEYLLGSAIKNFDRSKIVISTKCGYVKDKNNLISGINCTPENIKKSCEASLKRLNIDYIDIFYLHRTDPNVPIEISIKALSDLVGEGKVLNIGLSEVGPDTIKRAHEIHNISVIQSEYSIITRDVEREILPLCKKLGICFVAYCPIASGFLSGKIKSLNQLESNDFRRFFPRLQDNNISYNLNIVKILEDLSVKKSCTPAQVALAWLLAQGDNIVAIPGTKRIFYLEENVAALNVELSTEEISQLNEQVPFRFAKGDRLPPELSKLLNNYEVL